MNNGLRSLYTDGVTLRFVTGTDTTFKYETCAASACTTADSGVTPAANTWYHVKIFRYSSDAANSIRFCMGDCSSSTQITTNFPTAAVYLIFTYANNAGGTTGRIAWLDAISFTLANMTRW